MGHLPVPDDQRHLPRAKRQYPYRWLDDAEREEVRTECGKLFRGIEKMVAKIVSDIAPRYTSRADRDDLEQQVWTHLWSYSLPRFDAWRTPRIKPQTFCYRCSFLKTIELLRSSRRRRLRDPLIERLGGRVVAARDESRDREIEALADALLANPRRLGKFGRAAVERPGTSEVREVAALLGITTIHAAQARYDAREKAVSLLHSK